MNEPERERWRGAVDERLKQVEASQKALDAKTELNEANLHLLELKVQSIATKIGIYASLGAFVGGGAMSVIVGLFFKH